MEQKPSIAFLREIYAIYKEATLSRFRLLPEISSLATALLVVGTFNPDLLPLTCSVRLAISVLLLLVPISLGMYLWEANEAAVAAAKQIDEFIPGFSDSHAESIQEIIIGGLPLKRKLRALYAWTVVGCIFIFILLFVYHIWS